MKRNIKSLLIAALAVFGLWSCTNDQPLDDLTGKYPAPDTYAMNSLLSQERVKGEKVHNFNILVATEGVTLNGDQLAGEGAALSLKFLCNKYNLHPTSYTAEEAAKAKNGNYLIGEGGTELYVVKDGQVTTKAVKNGSIAVTIFEGAYNIYGALWMEDESTIKFDSTVEITYEPFTEAVKLTQVLSATSNVANGTPSLTLKLATDDVTYTYDAATWSEVYGGAGNYLALDIYSPDGYLYEGTYTPSAEGGVINAGEYGIGWDPGDMWGIGMVFENWGTCWWTVENGATSAEKITEGEIVVTKKGNKYTISYEYGDLWCEFTGALDDFNPGGSGNTDTTDYTELTQLMSATSNVANGTKSLTINMADANLAWQYNAATWSNEFTADGAYLALDIYSEDGKLYTGTYNAATAGGVINAGEFGIGWDPGDLWGIGMVFENWGTCWWNVAGGVAAAEKVVDGTVEVDVDGANLVIKLKSSTVNAKFTYPVAEFKDGSGTVIEVVDLGGPAEDTTEYEELTQLMSATSNVANGTKSLTINMADADLAWQYNAATWSNEFTADGAYLALDIYSEDGKLYTGTYNAAAAGGAIETGEFGIGWDPGDLWGIGMVFENWGTCWWTVAGGVATAEKVTDGTVDVSVEGENLVIKLKSSTVNAKFTYPVAEFKDGTGAAIEVVAGSTPTPEPEPEPDQPGQPAGEYTELVTLLSAQSNVGNGVPSLTISMAEAGLSSSLDPNTWQTVWTGEGNYLSMDIYSADGKLYTGTYEANTEGGVLAEGQFGIGYDTTVDWGFGPMEMKDWGTCWWTVAGGVATAEKVLDGTVEVAVDGANVVITLESETANARFTYPVADLGLEVI